MESVEDITKELRKASEAVITPGAWPLTIRDLDRKIIRLLNALDKRTETLKWIGKNQTGVTGKMAREALEEG